MHRGYLQILSMEWKRRNNQLHGMMFVHQRRWEGYKSYHLVIGTKLICWSCCGIFVEKLIICGWSGYIPKDAIMTAPISQSSSWIIKGILKCMHLVNNSTDWRKMLTSGSFKMKLMYLHVRGNRVENPWKKLFDCPLPDLEPNSFYGWRAILDWPPKKDYTGLACYWMIRVVSIHKLKLWNTCCWLYYCG